VRDTQLETGESVAVIGFPLATYDLTITEGIVSSLSGGGDSSLMTISAPANRGNSGGPVLDTNGLIVGVLTASQNDAQNTNYAVKSSAVRNFLSRRISYTPPRRQPSPPMNFTELAEHANWFTVRLICRTDNTGE
jgi:S1-C subfamily serine protease